MKKLKLVRTSSKPSSYGTYSYQIVNPEDAKGFKTYTAKNGDIFFYSYTRTGVKDIPFMADISVFKNAAGISFINIVDAGEELISELAYLEKQAVRYGISTKTDSIAGNRLFASVAAPKSVRSIPVAQQEEVFEDEEDDIEDDTTEGAFQDEIKEQPKAEQKPATRRKP